MPSRKKKKKAPRRSRAPLWIAVVLALIALPVCVAALNANTVHVRRAEVYMPDLPAAFDGATLLYVSDIDLCGLNGPAKAAALMRRLDHLHPDVWLLGGDYTSTPVQEILNSATGRAASDARAVAARADFFQRITDLSAPLGKYALAAPDDPAPEDLYIQLTNCGFTPLFNNRATLTRGDASIDLLGICDESANLNAASGSYSAGDCVIAAAWSPTILARLMITEAADSGRWVDLVLTGHTHGGQILAFGHSILPLNAQERKYMSGWNTETGVPVLTTSGIGCEGANLRLGSRAEAWLVTLRRGKLEAAEN